MTWLVMCEKCHSVTEWPRKVDTCPNCRNDGKEFKLVQEASKDGK
jgi:RNA polymerase subunit RPABC4/transcription elongation factor Spt4